MTMFIWALKAMVFVLTVSLFSSLFGVSFALVAPGGWAAWRVALLVGTIVGLGLTLIVTAWAAVERPWGTTRRGY